jgi:hypothetical protein
MGDAIYFGLVEDDQKEDALMARGKYLSLEEARKLKRLDHFCKEHPSEGDEQKFDELFERMAMNKPAGEKDE